MGVRKPITKVPQVVENDCIDQVVNGEQQNYVKQHTTLRISHRVKNSEIPSDYIVYLQESNYNIEAKNDLETFSQAMSSEESNLWYNVMKVEMDSMASNHAWNLVELPNGVKAIESK
ncbi:hypothetical protein CR513_28685, partial [Mucuna pruriens]